VVGIGAPIHFFLPHAAKTLGTEAVVPENADVANAIGAITSNVVVKRQLRIIPDEEGGFLIEGLAGVRHFKKFDDADAFARDELVFLGRTIHANLTGRPDIVVKQNLHHKTAAAN
jgi:hypothetical protein